MTVRSPRRDRGPVVAVIPARGGSKGLPGKNIRLLAGIPLIGHSILLAKMCPQIDRLIVSTDSSEIADVARECGADVPFTRPAELARDDTPMWPVLRHALQSVEELDGRRYGYVLLLQPTSPARMPEDIAGAFDRLDAAPDADGVVGVSVPEFNPIWHCVVERDGWMAVLVPSATGYERRQDVPPVYRVHGGLYIWHSEFVRRERESWRQGKHVMYETPDARAIDIDDGDQFERMAEKLRQGLIRLPWIQSSGAT